jgi:hypothetical protein
MTRLLPQILKIDRSTPIVAETDQIFNHRNFPLKSRAQISDGSGVGPWPYPEKFAMKISALQCLRMIEWE